MALLSLLFMGFVRRTILPRNERPAFVGADRGRLSVLKTLALHRQLDLAKTGGDGMCAAVGRFHVKVICGVEPRPVQKVDGEDRIPRRVAEMPYFGLPVLGAALPFGELKRRFCSITQVACLCRRCTSTAAFIGAPFVGLPFVCLAFSDSGTRLGAGDLFAGRRCIKLFSADDALSVHGLV